MTPLPVFIRPRAAQDLTEISGYIGARNPSAAVRLPVAIRADVERIAENLGMGSVKFVRGAEHLRDLRVWPVSRYRNYLVFYRATSEGIEVVRVLHGGGDIRRRLLDE